jgi:hypothetical protein
VRLVRHLEASILIGDCTVGGGRRMGGSDSERSGQLRIDTLGLDDRLALRRLRLERSLPDLLDELLERFGSRLCLR